jgi:uncharacterized protein (DUF2141 family)
MKTIFKFCFVVLSLILIQSCSSDSVEQPFDCNQGNLSISLSTTNNVTSCSDNNGSISVQATGGTAPYLFRINGGNFSSNSSFNNLAAGTYTVEVKDANGCLKVLNPSPSITNIVSSLSVSEVQKTSDTNCSTGNGTLTVTAVGGTTPYTYKIGNGSFGVSNVFNGLETGNYTITVKDAGNCEVTSNQTIERGTTGVSYINEIRNIIIASCNLPQCHSGSNGLPAFTSYADVEIRKNTIKTRLLNNSMPIAPGTISTENRQKIICWIDDGAPNN